MNVGAVEPSRWDAAQRAELDFHTRLAQPEIGASCHAQIAGLLRLGDRGIVSDKRVVDVGCGPNSLLLDYRPGTGSVAIDPLTFADRYERAYVAAGIRRVVAPAETFGEGFASFHEAWCYNCLQHVQDPMLVLRRLTRWATERIRLFEWVNEPLSEYHLHVLSQGEIAMILRDCRWHPTYEITGQWNGAGVDRMHFYASHWVPNGGSNG